MHFILRLIFQATFAFAISFLLLAYAPGLLNIDPISVRVKPCPPFQGPLTINKELEPVKKLYVDELIGPESLASFGDDLCTGLRDGRIVCVNGGKINFITQIGNPLCEGNWEEHICGRPLGMRFDKKGLLYVADGYYGIYKVDIKTGTKAVIYNINTEVDGRKSTLINDLDVGREGDLYFTDSGQWQLKEGMYGLLEMKPKGRILHFNPRSNTTTSLVEGIAFANGIQLSPNEDFLLVSETAASRVLKYHLKGSNKGQMKTFADNLPGYPDNVRLNSRGHYWVPLCGTRSPSHSSLLELLGEAPLARKVMARGLHLLQTILEKIKNSVGLPVYLKEVQYNLANMEPYATLASPSHGIVTEFNEKGEMVRSLHDPTGSVRFISEVAEYKGNLYFGSPWHNFLGVKKIS